MRKPLPRIPAWWPSQATTAQHIARIAAAWEGRRAAARVVAALVLAICLLAAAARAPAGGKATPDKPETVRELYVPMEDLSPILQGDPNRVLLSRQEYEALRQRAETEDQHRPPRSALVTAADYEARLGEGRAEISGTLTMSVLEKGLHAVGLDVAGVGLASATLDGKPAPIGLASDGRLTLFVQGEGRHELVLEVVAPLETTAARQILAFRLPMPSAARMRLTAPGDVEIKSGAAVASRVFDEKAEETRIEILPTRGDVTLVMTLNSRLLRRDRIVVARSVLLDEVTAAYERLHATVSMEILHRAVGRFRFAVPKGFDVTDVRTPNLSAWAIEAEPGGRRILDVTLRDETTETTVLNLSAVRTAPDLAAWSLATFEPLDVVGHVAVVGLAVEDRLKAEAVEPEGLIPIDTAVLTRALPATVLEAQPGAARIRPVAAYYAPQGRFALAARVVRPPARLHVTTNVLALLEDGGLTARGGFALVPEQEKLFAFDVAVPAGWDVVSVTGAGGKAVPFQRYPAEGGGSRLHVRLPNGVAAGAERRVFFEARHVPKGWFGAWPDGRRTLAFPVFAVLRGGRGEAMAIRDTGAIAVDARDDMIVRPAALEGLMPLDANEKKRYGLEGVAASLAYRYDQQPYTARLTVRREVPRTTAQTFSFFRVERDALAAHYEIVFEVGRARARRLALALPPDTPTALSIRGLGGVELKEYTSELVGEGESQGRVWTAMLAEPRSGTVRLAVDFEQRLEELEPDDLALPVIRAEGVAYQSGLVAVEGSAELDVRVTEAPRKVDIGELVDAEYQPGRRLLGAYGFLGEPATIRVSVAEHPDLGLPPAIIQRAELATVLASDGLAQTAARFHLKTKSLFLDVRLPADSILWSATLDGRPVKPRREGDRLLLNLPAAGAGQVRDLRIVYQTPVTGLDFWRKTHVLAPRLFLHAGEGAEAAEVPAVDLLWHLYPPSGYRVIRTEGTVETTEVRPPALAVANVAGALYMGTGGVDFDHGALGLILDHGFLPGGCAAPLAAPADRWVAARGDAEATGEDFFGEPLEENETEGRESGAATAPAAVTPQAELRFHRGTEISSNSMRKFADDKADMAAGEKAEAMDALALHHGMNARAGADESGRLPVDTGNVVLNGDATSMEDVAVIAGGATVNGSRPATEPAPVEKPPAPPLQPPAPPTKPTSKTKAMPDKVVWALQGLRSLTIDLHRTGEAVEFRSLGAEPAMAVTCVDEERLGALAWGLALAVLVVGVALTAQTVGRKAAYVVGVGVAATLVPVVTGRIELAMVVNGAFYAACLLVPYYLAAGVVRWVWRKVADMFWPAPAAAGTAAVVLLAALFGLGGAAMADEKDRPYVVQIVPPEGPVKVPADAIILPYDPESKTGVRDADRLLVPYARYVELWNRAYPDKPIGEKPPPAPYALAGAAFTARLEGEKFLLLEGRVDLDVYEDDYVQVPLPLSGGVLARADLDGSPARVSMVEPKPRKGGKAPQAARPAAPAFVVLYVSGKGRHRLDVSVRMPLERQGGWRVTDGHLPAAPATSLALTVPQAGTEVRLGHVLDKAVHETAKPGAVIRTALGASGAVRIQWRPKIGEGQIEKTLTARSRGVLDVQEDRLHLTWEVRCEFRHGERDVFTLAVPEGYTVEKVEGTNVRGWQRKDADGRSHVVVSLLKPAKGSESFTVTVWRRTAGGPGGEAKPFAVPFIDAPGALRHTGTLLVRRSPLLDVRTVETTGVRRTDLPPAEQMPGKGHVESPLGIRPYQAYEFVATPFTVRLASEPVDARVVAKVQTILRLAERERSLEARVVLTVGDRPLYLAQVAIPDDLELDRVQAPGAFEWAVTKADGRRVLTVYLAAGVQGTCPVVIEGKLARGQIGLETAVPRLHALGVDRQRGDIVVQADPAFDVRPEGLANLERVLMKRISGWLGAGQDALAALALEWREPDYAGRLVLVPRKPDVSCFTVTNARVTDRSIDETILLNWTIQKAGIREVVFQLPAWMAEARISAPLLRQKIVEPAGNAPDAPVRVRLTLQDQVMDELRVLVENDRLLEGEAFAAPVPVVETGRTTRRYVALESAGRDEVVVTATDGLEPLGRRQKEWATVAGMLRGGSTQAFIVTPGAEAPRLAFQTRRREAVETVQARIGLAETDLVLDVAGAYRGQVVYHVDNRTEQFLEVAMPPGADLWTAVVAGEPVKPTRIQGEAAGLVRIPIVKTAEGDLDYAVVLKYGGRVDPLGAWQYRVRFPLVRAVNVEAELSQVRLWVPEEYAWLDFETDMSHVEEAGTLEANALAYQQKVARRLLATLQSDNPFAKTRAYVNLKQIGRSIEQEQVDLQSYAGNTAVQLELSNAGIILEEVNKELQGQPDTGQVTVDFNNDLMRQTYERQRNRRDRNLVQEVGPNCSFEAGTQVTTQPGKVGAFNNDWLAKNKLDNEAAQMEQAKPQTRYQYGADQMQRQQGAQAAQPQQQAEIAGQMFKQFTAGKDVEKAPKGQKMAELQRRHTQADVVERYQQKLAQRADRDEDIRRKARKAAAPKREATILGGWGGLGKGRGFFGAGGEGEAPAEVPEGLASLDVQMPRRGTLYRFSMVDPPQDVGIAAMTAAEATVDSAERVAAVVVLLGLLLIVRRWLRGRTFDLRTQATVAMVLIVLGVLGAAFGVFPLAGVLAVLVGLGIAVRLFVVRRTGAAA